MKNLWVVIVLFFAGFTAQAQNSTNVESTKPAVGVTDMKAQFATVLADI